MSVMTPILRLRKVIRSIGANDEQADEFADAMGQYPSQREFQIMMEEAHARLFNRLALLLLAALGVAVAVVAALMVALN